MADAGLLLATLTHHLGLHGLVDEHLDLGIRPGAANTGDKLATLVMSALAGGDCESRGSADPSSDRFRLATPHVQRRSRDAVGTSNDL